jgi:serine/threonine protein kinase
VLKPEIFLKSAEKEYKVLLQARQEECCHLVWLVGLGLELERNQVSIVTDDAGDTWSKRVKEAEDPSSLKQPGSQLSICFQLLLAVQELRALGLHHLDINPSNIALHSISSSTAGGSTQYYLRLFDFGISKKVGSDTGEVGSDTAEELLDQMLTAEYCAPELVGPAVKMDSLSLEAADVWGVGCSMMYLQTGEGQVQGFKGFRF